MAASAGWWKPTLLLCFFGVQTFVFGILAEDRNPFWGTSGTIIGDGYARCRFPNLTATMGGLSVVSLLLTILAGHLAVFFNPYPANNANQQPAGTVPRLALLRSTSLIVFFVVAELVSASSMAMLHGATIRETGLGHYLVMWIAGDGTVSCPTAPMRDGRFGAGALLALGATIMWIVCQLLALEARANYLDGLNGDDDKGHGGSNKKHDDFTDYA